MGPLDHGARLCQGAFREHRMTFKFERARIHKIPREAILAELERVAEHPEFVEFGKREFDGEGWVSSSTVVRTFGAWSNAIQALRGALNRRGINLKVPEGLLLGQRDVRRDGTNLAGPGPSAIRFDAAWQLDRLPALADDVVRLDADEVLR